MARERWFYGSEEEFSGIAEKLERTPCPHCRAVGPLIRHGFLRGYDEKHTRQRTVRARRIFCSNRKARNGCGRTFSVWVEDKIRRLSLTAGGLWTFLKGVADGGDKLGALRGVAGHLTESAPCRIWMRFEQAQCAIRTALVELCEAPEVPAERPQEQTIAHLQAAFPKAACPIIDFQRALRTFFL